MKYKNPEQAIKAFKLKKYLLLNQQIIALDQIDCNTYA